MLFPDDPDFSESEAKKQLDPIRSMLRNAVIECADVIIELGRERPLLAKAMEYLATRQHLMNSLVVERIKESVTSGDLPEAEITLENRFAELQVGSIDIRFKQVGKDGRTANYPTAASRRYKNQLPLLGGPETLSRIRLTLGWRWNTTATEIEDIVVVYAKGEAAQWMFSILHGEQDGSARIVVPTGTSPHGSGTGVTFPAADKDSKSGA